MPRTLSTREQTSNIVLEQEIEKYPCLYNYKIKDYARRDVTDAAWEKVAIAVHNTVSNCKEKWRNLRTVFIRKQKPPPSGSGKKAAKPYYLNDIMQFIIPFVKVQSSEEIPSNVPSPPSPDDQLQHYDERSVVEENTESEVSHELAHTEPLNPKETSSHMVNTERIMSSSQNTTKKKLVNKNKTKPDLDSAFMDYFQSKKRKIEEPNSARKHFLLSVLPDVEQLSDIQFRVFRRQLLDDLDFARSYQASRTTDTGSCHDFSRTDTPSSVGSLTNTNLASRSAPSPNYPQQLSFPLFHVQNYNEELTRDLLLLQ